MEDNKQEMKLCKDCKYFKGADIYADDCYHPSALLFQDTSRGRKFYKDAYDMRHSSLCGKEARLFEPIPPSIFKRVFNYLFRREK